MAYMRDVDGVRLDGIQIAPKLPLYAKDFGFGASGASASANTSALNSAIAAAMAAGRDLLLPHVGAFGTALDINDAITVSGAGFIHIYGEGGRSVKIHQTVKPKTIFYVTAPGVRISGVALYGDGIDMTGMGTPVAYAAYCGIWFGPGSDGGSYNDIYAEGLHRGVRVDPDPTTATSSTPNLNNITGTELTGKDCWTILTVVQADNSIFRGIYGNSKKATATDGTDVGQPDHGVYVIDRTGDGRGMHNTSIQNGHITSTEIGKAYAIKGITGGSSSHLHADSCHGVLDIIATTDYDYYDILSTNDTYPDSGVESSYASLSFDTTPVRTRVIGANIQFAHADHGEAILLDGTNNQVIMAATTGNRVTEVTSNAGPVLFKVKGQKNRLEHPVATSVGANMWAAIHTSDTGQYGKVINPRTIGNFKLGVVAYGMHDTVIDYDPALVETNGKLNGATDLGTNAKAIAALGTTLRPKIRPRDRQAPNGPEYFFFERGTDAALSGHAGRATSGQAATLQTATFTTDLTNAYGRIMNSSTSTTTPGVMLFSTQRELADAAISDFSLEMELVYNATNPNALVGLAFSGADASNLLSLCFTGTGAATPQLQLFKVDTGTITVLGSPTVMTPVAGTRYALKVVKVGNMIKCFLDGTLVQTYTLTGGDITKYATQTTVGYYCMLSTNTRFCDVTGKRVA
ncbi:MAG TPA: hypothetical protein VHZ98_15995 [Galbitalea sp.]|jgi:hypothetical protein|nr:hypothetical protein [Galbitalea sp.]